MSTAEDGYTGSEYTTQNIATAYLGPPYVGFVSVPSRLPAPHVATSRGLFVGAAEVGRDQDPISRQGLD